MHSALGATVEPELYMFANSVAMRRIKTLDFSLRDPQVPEEQSMRTVVTVSLRMKLTAEARALLPSSYRLEISHQPVFE